MWRVRPYFLLKSVIGNEFVSLAMSRTPLEHFVSTLLQNELELLSKAEKIPVGAWKAEILKDQRLDSVGSNRVKSMVTGVFGSVVGRRHNLFKADYFKQDVALGAIS